MEERHNSTSIEHVVPTRLFSRYMGCEHRNVIPLNVQRYSMPCLLLISHNSRHWAISTITTYSTLNSESLPASHRTMTSLFWQVGLTLGKCCIIIENIFKNVSFQRRHTWPFGIAQRLDFSSTKFHIFHSSIVYL